MFDKNSFFNTILGFIPDRDYKDYGIEYYNEKNRNFSLIKKININCDCVDGSVLNGVRQPTLINFVLDKQSGYKVFCKPETKHYQK